MFLQAREIALISQRNKINTSHLHNILATNFTHKYCVKSNVTD